jgi:hypothetical protein
MVGADPPRAGGHRRDRRTGVTFGLIGQRRFIELGPFSTESGFVLSQIKDNVPARLRLEVLASTSRPPTHADTPCDQPP